MAKKKPKRGFEGVWIPKEIWLAEDLNWIEKVLLKEITSLAAAEEGCFASNKHFAEFFGVTNRTISARISSLRAKGYIAVADRTASGGGRRMRPTGKLPSTPRNKSSTPPEETFHPPLEETFHHNSTVESSTDNNTDISISSSKPKKPEPMEGFNEFWQAYPRKVGKGAARRAWDKISPDTGLQTILDQVARQRETEQWADPKYVPHPATWLNQQRWLDEPDSPSRARVFDRDGYDQEGYDIHGNTRYGTHALSLQELFAMYQARGQFREIDCYQWERASDEFQRRMKAEGRKGAPSFGIPSDQHEGLIMAIVREQEEADRQKNGPPLKGNG